MAKTLEEKLKDIEKQGKSIILYLKGTKIPLVLFVEDPEEDYLFFQKYLLIPAAMTVERKLRYGNTKKISIPLNKIIGVALQDYSNISEYAKLDKSDTKQ